MRPAASHSSRSRGHCHGHRHCGRLQHADRRRRHRRQHLRCRSDLRAAVRPDRATAAALCRARRADARAERPRQRRLPLLLPLPLPRPRPRQRGTRPALMAALMSEGARNYERNCQVCHGNRGQGRSRPNTHHVADGGAGWRPSQPDPARATGTRHAALQQAQQPRDREHRDLRPQLLGQQLRHRDRSQRRPDPRPRLGPRDPVPPGLAGRTCQAEARERTADVVRERRQNRSCSEQIGSHADQGGE